MRRFGLLLVAAALLAQTTDTLTLDQDHPAILWLSTQPGDAVARLNGRLRAGEAKLEARGKTGYLESVLQALGVPISSQMLVFSRSSLQRQFISPGNPRALYFNDTTAVGYIPGTPILELATLDARQGVNFYTLNQAAAEPRFVRQTSCTTCHETALGVPGFVLQSIPTAVDGQVLYQHGYWPSDDRTPFENRWGGWYVTGRHEAFAHMGNRTIADARAAEPKLAEALPAREKAPGVEGYLAQTSDIAALLVFEHQAETANWITRLNWHARIAAFNKQPAEVLQPTVRSLVDALVFAGEQELPKPVRGTSGFAEEFAGRGKRDQRGRSLRDLDLTKYVFRYPLSYLIDSEAFDALPSEAKAMVYARLREILSGTERSAPYVRFDEATRRALTELLSDTKPEVLKVP